MLFMIKQEIALYGWPFCFWDMSQSHAFWTVIVIKACITASTPIINEKMDDSIDDSHSSSDELCDTEHDEIKESDTEDSIDTEIVTEPFNFTSYIDFFK